MRLIEDKKNINIPTVMFFSITTRSVLIVQQKMTTLFQCLIESVTKHETCPYPSCNEVIVQGSERVVLFKEIFSQMFPVYEASYTKNDHCSNDGEEHVVVTCLTGESLRIPLSKSMTVDHLKDKIQNRLTHQKNKQKLLYNGKDMEVNTLIRKNI